MCISNTWVSMWLLSSKLIGSRLLHEYHVKTIELIPSKSCENVEENFSYELVSRNNAGGEGGGGRGEGEEDNNACLGGRQ